jgi:zinc transport system substrate-binding protein
MPDRETISKYQQADIILLNGAGYARWVDKVSLSRLRKVDTSKAFRDGLITIKEAVAHGHGPDGEHSHGSMAFVTWLDFYQAVQQARAIADVLASKRPENKAEFEKNFDALRTDLMALDLSLQRIVAANPRPRLFASHPVYHYLARRYEITIEDMVWEPDKVPDEQEWIKLRLAQERFTAELMLWEKQPLPRIVQQLDAMGLGVAVFDPCANRPASGDFLSVMRRNIVTLEKALNSGH